MHNVSDWLKWACGGLGLLFGWLFGAPDAVLLVLIVMVVLDYITGVMAGAVRRELSSSVGFKGIVKKVFIFVIVAVASLVDKIVPGANGAMRAAVCLFYIANEGLSIVENAVEMGVPFPQVLMKALVVLRNKGDGQGGDDEGET